MEPINIDLSHSTCGVWLVKMPKYLSQILNDYGESMPGGEVGRLVKKNSTNTNVGPSKAQDVVFRLNDHIFERLKQQNPTIEQLPPREHRFILSNISDGVIRSVYTRTPTQQTSQPEQIAVVGKVIQRAEVRPVEDEQYMSMKRIQIERSQEPARKVQLIKRLGNVYKARSNHDDNIENERIKKLHGKRIRLSEEQVADMLFNEFQQHQYISMQSLEQKTQQPRPFLKELLEKYCVRNSRGPNARTYELKPEYRHYKKTDDTSAGSSSSM